MTDPTVARLTFTSMINRPPTERKLARLLAVYLERLEEEVARSPGDRVMPGVAALLRRLTAVGILLGVVSGALEAAVHIKLGRGQLTGCVSVGGYGSDSADGGELTRLAIARCGVIHGHAVAAERVLIVGDTPRDIDAAHAAGAIGVGVAKSMYSVDELRAAGADHVVATLETPLPGVAEELARRSASAG